MPPSMRSLLRRYLDCLFTICSSYSLFFFHILSHHLTYFMCITYLFSVHSLVLQTQPYLLVSITCYCHRAFALDVCTTWTIFSTSFPVPIPCYFTYLVPSTTFILAWMSLHQRCLAWPITLVSILYDFLKTYPLTFIELIYIWIIYMIIWPSPC